MEEEKKVKLYGRWGSTFYKRVELALKIKGIPYECVEEDLSNKSQLFLQYKLVQKKVPVLVHDGRPIVESLVILEYIDENWKGNPQLLPKDPFERAKVRFWGKFLHQQLLLSIGLVITKGGEEQERAMKVLFENLKMVEEGMQDLFLGGTPYINGENLGFLDIVMSSILSPHRAIEEAIGVKIIDPERNPVIFSWVTTLSDLPVVKETLPPHDMLVALVQFIRQKNLLQSPKVEA
ncbi:hypothetical protein HHK36_029782 [Tetracentron sinense]|uniref:Glutathione S-transferase n=1 Tax=Tetracentron sinense TaxID=13715 RepID=A0A835CZN3_TETSI|nr:hypothetical protein HHK36_029782 [Tetracentron sinense]